MVAAIIAMSRPLIAGQDDDVKKRIAALEAVQQAILKELQEIRAMLLARPIAQPAATPTTGGVVPTVQAAPNIDLETTDAPSLGPVSAKITIVEFSDFQCPFCGRYSRDTFPQVERDYVSAGKIRYVFRHYPLERIHPRALKAAEAGECAHQQGKFWEMHTRLFANQQALAESDLVKSAEALGLNSAAFQQCLAGRTTERIRHDQADGSRAGISGTPMFFLGTTMTDGKVHVLRKLSGAKPYAAFKAAIDEMLASAP